MSHRFFTLYNIFLDVKKSDVIFPNTENVHQKHQTILLREELLYFEDVNIMVFTRYDHRKLALRQKNQRKKQKVTLFPEEDVPKDIRVLDSLGAFAGGRPKILSQKDDLRMKKFKNIQRNSRRGLCFVYTNRGIVSLKTSLAWYFIFVILFYV